LTFPKAILGLLLFPILSSQTLSLLHHSPNPLQLGYVLFLALHQVLEGLSDSLVLLHKFSECLFNSTQNPIIGRDHGQRVSIDMGLVLLFEGDIPSTCKRLAMKIIRSNKK